MPGKLRKRHRHDQGVPRETPETSTAPLIAAAGVEAGLPGALGLPEELEAAGYYSASLLGQWSLVHDALAEHAREAPDPVEAALALGRHDDPRARFFAPGVLARLLADYPEAGLAAVRRLAGDPDFRVAEAVQAFGVRPQVRALEERAVACLLPWVADPVPQVRRAAVEGSRPRGVWVKRMEWVVRAPARLLPLLEPLRAESHRYVANAVGNSLNDLSKDHPRLAVDVVERWLREDPRGPLTEHMGRKALRTLTKTGDPFALRAFGFGDLDVEVEADLANGATVPPNTALRFRLAIRNRGPAASAQLVYEIRTPGKNPRKPRSKRYHGGTLSLPAGDVLPVERRERIFDTKAAPLIDGPCEARFFLNGAQVAQVDFELRRANLSSRARGARG